MTWVLFQAVMISLFAMGSRQLLEQNRSLTYISRPAGVIFSRTDHSKLEVHHSNLDVVPRPRIMRRALLEKISALVEK
jgi:uncharacterized circularly permuted ATP-grasp superfamily protein